MYLIIDNRIAMAIMRNIMPARVRSVSQPAAARVIGIGASIRDQRLASKRSLTSVASAAGISRVTLYRIEKGVGSVTMGAIAAVLEVLELGLSIGVLPTSERVWIKTVRVANFPMLNVLAGKQPGDDSSNELTAKEALALYRSHWHELELSKMIGRERELVEGLFADVGLAMGPSRS